MWIGQATSVVVVVGRCGDDYRFGSHIVADWAEQIRDGVNDNDDERCSEKIIVRARVDALLELDNNTDRIVCRCFCLFAIGSEIGKPLKFNSFRLLSRKLSIFSNWIASKRS